MSDDDTTRHGKPSLDEDKASEEAESDNVKSRALTAGKDSGSVKTAPSSAGDRIGKSRADDEDDEDDEKAQ